MHEYLRVLESDLGTGQERPEHRCYSPRGEELKYEAAGEITGLQSREQRSIEPCTLFMTPALLDF